MRASEWRCLLAAFWPALRMPCATNLRRRTAHRSKYIREGSPGYRMVSGVFSVARELPRLREISSVLIRYGFGDIVRGAGVSTLLERAGQVLQWGQASEVAHLEPQQRARLALEQLGPTFVKLGQVLSTREDLLPSTWTEELNQLYSRVAPVPFDDLLPQIEQALGRSPFESQWSTQHGTFRPQFCRRPRRARPTRILGMDE